MAESQGANSSGAEPGLRIASSEQTARAPEAAAGAQHAPRCFFARLTPDASPGANSVIITGLPAGTRAISVWVTEWTANGGGQSHAGQAVFTTSSVQLFANGTQCRVLYHLHWTTHLPAGVQVIYC